MKNSAGLYYIPLDNTIPGEVTAGNIAEKAVYKWNELSEEFRTHLLFDIMGGGNAGHFNERSIRLKLDHGQWTLLVDADGVYSYSGNIGHVNMPMFEATMRGLISPSGRDEIHSLLHNSMGPYPWYDGQLQDLTIGDKKFKWSGNRSNILIQVLQNKPLLVLGTYANAFLAAPGYIGVLGKKWQIENGEILGNSFVVSVFDVANMEPLPLNFDTDSKDKTGLPYAAGVKPVEEFNVPNNLEEGTHGIYRSLIVNSMPELMFMASGPLRNGKSDDSLPAASVYIWRPKTGSVEVIPQKWFTGDKYDLGYQWITQVMRNPKTGNIIGSGIRLPEFELDSSGKNLLRAFEYGEESDIH